MEESVLKDPLEKIKNIEDYSSKRHDRHVFASQNLQEQINSIVQAYNAIIIRHLDGRIVAWNEGAVALYGWSEEDTQGKKIHALLQTQFQEEVEVIERVLLKEGQWEGKLMQTHRTGRCMIVESRQVLVRTGPRQPAVIVEMHRDESKQELLAQDYIEATVREIALQETAQQMNTFVSLVSHELKTPLTSIKGNLQLAQRHLIRLQQETSDELIKQAITTIQHALDRADRQITMQNRLINDLIDISRIQTHQLNVQPAPCDLVLIVQEVIEDQRILMPNRLIRWTPSILQAPVLADADRIGQVINNYLSNALKYSPVDTPVDVRLEQEEMMIRVSVRDEGSGISETQQRLIWQQFYRVEEHKRPNGGDVVSLGLGLYISRTLIEQHGGAVGVESELECGSTFWFTLPSISPEEV